MTNWADPEGNEEGTKPAVGAAVGTTSETLTGSSPSAEEGGKAGLGGGEGEEGGESDIERAARGEG